MRGRKPLPTSLKKLKGTLQKCRTNKGEPKPELNMPEMPEHLSPHAVEMWQEIAPKLHALGLLTEIDGGMLALLCEAYSMYRESRAIVQKEGMVIEVVNSAGDTLQKVHPAYKIMVGARINCLDSSKSLA